MTKIEEIIVGYQPKEQPANYVPKNPPKHCLLAQFCQKTIQDRLENIEVELSEYYLAREFYRGTRIAEQIDDEILLNTQERRRLKKMLNI